MEETPNYILHTCSECRFFAELRFWAGCGTGGYCHPRGRGIGKGQRMWCHEKAPACDNFNPRKRSQKKSTNR